MFNKTRKAVAALLILPGALLLAQSQLPPITQPQQGQSTPLLSPDQLDNLVAPIALYPDPLLGQVMAASTYPLEVVEAQQWLQQNSNLHGSQLMDAARQQNWDASVQALVAFPDVLTLLNRDVRWTTDLGNAFLAQQADVMAAVQRMRVRAQQNGRLRTTPQETVTDETQNGQSAVVIEPANPQVIYVPQYNPEYIWGPPVYGYYPPLWYPSIGFGFGFGPGIFLSGLFPGWGVGWGGWGLGWGWGCGWFGRGLFVNNFFFNHYGFHGYYGGGYGYRGGYAAGGRGMWQHDPYHRAGVPYANRTVATRFNNSRYAAGRYSRGSAGMSSGFNGGRTFGANASRSYSPGNRGYSTPGNNRSYSSPGANRGYSSPGYNRSYSSPGAGRGYSSPGYNRSYSSPGYNRSYSSPGYNRSYSAPSNRSYSSPGYNRSYSAPSYNRSYSAPSRSYSAPRSSGGGFSHSYSAPRSFGGGGGGHYSGGGGGGHFSGGGHSSGGGGHHR